MKKNGLINILLNKKGDMVKLIFSAILLALGTSLFANYLTNELVNKNLIILYISILIIVIVLLFFSYLIYKDSFKKITTDGVLIFNKDSKKVQLISRYGFSDKMFEAINAVTLENLAIKKVFDEHWNTIEKDKEEDQNTVINNSKEKSKTDIKYMAIHRLKVDNVESIKEKTKLDTLINEILEYVILDFLSTKLSVYFNDFDDEDKYIMEYTRKDFPNILLENKVINLLSTNIEDRGIFNECGIKKEKDNEEIVMIKGSDGSLFSRFDLILPRGSKVTRPNFGEIQIENKRIIINIKIVSNVFTQPLPQGFAELYLGAKNSYLDSRKIVVELSYRIKPLALLLNSKWNYHEWIDDFAEELNNFISFKKFIEKINWDSNLTNFIIERNVSVIRANSKKGKEKTEDDIIKKNNVKNEKLDE